MPGGYQRFPFDQSRSNVIKRKFSLAYASARFLSATTTRTHKEKRERDRWERRSGIRYAAIFELISWHCMATIYYTSFLRPQGAGVESTEYRKEKSKWDDDYMERWRQTKEGESKIKSTYSIRLFFEVMGSSSHLLCPRIVYVRVSVSSAYLARERIPHHTLTQSHPCRLVR